MPRSYRHISQYEKEKNAPKGNGKNDDLEDQKRGEDKYTYNKRLFYVNDKTISIRQFKEKGIGGIFWDTVKYLFLFQSSQF
jgi:hypothetical protein